MDRIVGLCRDSCATNGVACQQLLSLCVNATDLLCSSHTLQHTGEHLQLTTVEEFLSPWLSLVSHSHTPRLLWERVTGSSMKSFSKTRWWSRWEIMKDLAVNFGTLGSFLDLLDREGVGGATTQSMSTTYHTKKETLQLELALAMDMEVLCTTTYLLEGDNLEILLVHDLLEGLRERGRSLGTNAAHFPNVAAILRSTEPIVAGLATLEYYVL